MKPYLFGMTVCHHRTGVPVGHRVGVVFADSEDDALEKAWDKFGNDYTCKLWVEEVPQDGIMKTIWGW